MKIIRNIIFYKDYFETFYQSLTEREKYKLDEVLYLISITERVPIKFLKKIKNQNGLYEVRIEFQSNIFRIFCCFDEPSLVILFNGFHKKSKKTPQKEIQIAEKLKKEYFKNK